MKRRQFIVMSGVGMAGFAGCSGASSESPTEDGSEAESQYDARLEPIVTDIPSYPIGCEFVQDGEVQLIPDKSGRVHVLEDGSMNEKPLLDLSEKLTKIESWEQGIVGFTVDPSFETTRRIYVRYSGSRRDGTPDEYSHTAVLSEFEVPPDFSRIDPDSERVVLRIPEPGAVHNGGGLEFGPDGYLYIGVGDGGGGQFDSGPGHVEDWYDGVDGGNGQDVEENLHGSILRIDVDDRDGDQPYGIPSDNPLVDSAGFDEQYAWGLRNPYAMSWTDGKLIAGDVGQDHFEEVNVIEKAGNYGWNVREGQSCLTPDSEEDSSESCPETTEDGESLIEPVAGYEHRDTDSRTTAVVAGYMYAGEALPALEDKYVFGDLYREQEGHIFAADPTETEDGLWAMTELSVVHADGESLTDGLVSISEDQHGELYVSTYNFQETTGGVYKLVPPE